MHRIPPSQQIGKKLDELLSQGLKGEGDVTTTIIRLGVERLVQELLEQEVTDYLEREHYQRRQPEQEHRGCRNGCEPGCIRTAEREFVVQVPQVRDAPETYRSELMTFLRGNSDVLQRLAVEMYARGLSTRDIEDALVEATGDRLLSRTAVSQVTEVSWAEYETFASRDLSGLELEYLLLDAVDESLRQQGGLKEGILAAWGIYTDGCKVLLHLALRNKDSYANWLDLLRDMVKRSLQTPALITTDGAPGLIRAVEEIIAHKFHAFPVDAGKPSANPIADNDDAPAALFGQPACEERGWSRYPRRDPPYRSVPHSGCRRPIQLRLGDLRRQLGCRI